jgi:hypothetical protein
MSSSAIDHPAKVRAETSIPGARPAAQSEPVEAKIVVQGGNAAIAGYMDLAKAYQALATKNAERLSASIQALAGVKSPTEFLALQHKLIAEAVDAAMHDGAHIAKLTTHVFAAAFEPVQKQIEAFKAGGKV